MLEQDCRNTRAGIGQVEQDTQKMTLRTDIQNRWPKQEKQNRTQPDKDSQNWTTGTG
jgi:hypothetical protein